MADHIDMWLMGLGFIGAVADGLSAPVFFFFGNRLMNTIGSAPTLDPQILQQDIIKNALPLLYWGGGIWFAGFFEAYCWTRTGERQATRMRAKYLKAVLRQDVAYFDLHITSSSEVVTSVSNDSLLIQDVLGEKVPNLLMNLTMFVGNYIVAFLLLWRLAIVGVLFVPLLVVPGIVFGRKLIGLARKTKQEYNKVGVIAEQAISSIRTVYAFVGESKTLSDFSAAQQGSVKLGLRQGLAKGLAIGSNGIVFAIWSFMIYYGSRLVMYHGARGGTVYMVGTAIALGGLAFGSCLSNLKSFSDGYSAAERIRKMVGRVPLIDSENLEGEVPVKIYGDVEFKQVQFAYPSRPETIVLQEFSLKIPAGKTVALVGSSGSGKSTVISLLQRFYDPLGGEIFLDGVAINKLQLKWLRSRMGLVSQEPILFAASIKENILFGKEDAETEQVIEAAKSSNAHSFISQLPQGYDTQVGERGVQLSGGQKQRIAIARAIIRAPEILLLDEATSALDSESERVVQEALEKASRGRTTIVIAHRLSTIRNADLIAVVQDGQLMEMGSHHELIQNDNSHYASLLRLQETGEVNTSSTNTENNITISSGSQSLINADNLSKPTINESCSDSLPAAQEQHKYSTPSIRRLVAMNRPEWKQAAVAWLSAAMFGAVQPVYALGLGSMVSVLFLTDHDEIKKNTRFYALCFLGVAVFTFTINVIQHRSFAYVGENLTKRVREKMLSKILSFEVGWFDRDENSSGAVCSRLDEDANVVRSLISEQISLTIQTLSALGLAFTLALVIAWKLALVMIAVQPIQTLCMYTRKVVLQSFSKKAAKAQAQSSKLASEVVYNVRTITAFSSQNKILTMLDKAQQGSRLESLRLSCFAGLVLATTRSMMTLTWVLYYWYGGMLISKGEITAKEFFETFLILVGTGRVISDAATMTTDIAKGSNALGSIFAILDRTPQIDANDYDGLKCEKIAGDVEFCDVDFTYPSRPNAFVFKGFSIKIEQGKSTAFVGESGSGKSTIISLIERFYDPIKGTVKIDGHDVRSYHLRSLRRHIALVSQEPTLFVGTIKDNIAYGASSEISESEIIEAAKAANAHDFISSLKDGYDTSCGDRGMQLSGGQKQRIAIARAILRKPTLLLLDEATSALDNQSEKVVQEAIERVMVGRTSIVVAHRLSTIQNCNVIVVLDKGRLIEQGNHSSLLAKGSKGAYYSLVNLQKNSGVVD